MELQELARLATLVHKTADGKTIAALPLPAEWEGKKSASRVSVTTKGVLIRSKLGNTFIKESTYKELKDANYRKAVRHNLLLIKNSSQSLDRNRATVTTIKEWYEAVRDTIHPDYIRIGYGGDFLNTYVYRQVYLLQQHVRIWREEGKEIIPTLFFTSSTDTLNDLALCKYPSLGVDNILNDPDMYLMLEVQAYEDLPLVGTRYQVSYHWEHEDVDKMVGDLDVLPDPEHYPLRQNIDVCIPEEVYEYFEKNKG